jgi:hypothetical protein
LKFGDLVPEFGFMKVLVHVWAPIELQVEVPIILIADKLLFRDVSMEENSVLVRKEGASLGWVELGQGALQVL